MNKTAQKISTGLSLSANFSWTFIGNIVYTGCQWGMLIAIAKLGSPNMVGQFALGLTITAPIFMFASFELRNIQASDARLEYKFGDYLALRIIAVILSLILIVGISIFTDYRRETTLVILAVALTKAIECISDIFYGFLQQHERMDRVAISLILRGLLSLAALCAGVYLTGGVFWGTVGMAIVWVLVLILYDVHGVTCLYSMQRGRNFPYDPSYNETNVYPSWDKKILRKLTWLALPLGIAALLSSLDTNIPRYFIEKYLGESLLGIFAALAYFDRAGKLLMHALGRSATARLSQYYATGENKLFGSLLLKLAWIGAIIGGIGVLIAIFSGRPLITILYKPEYVMNDVFILLMIAAGLNYVTIFLTYGLIASRHFRIQVILNIIVTAILIFISVWLIPLYGLYGAAIAVLLTRLVEAGGIIGITLYLFFIPKSPIAVNTS